MRSRTDDSPERLAVGDFVRIGGSGLRARPGRALLSAFGIAVGVGALVAIVGITVSSSSGLDRTLAQLGTNMLTVAPGQEITGGSSQLPITAQPMIERIRPVTAVSAFGQVAGATVVRNDLIPVDQSDGLLFAAAQPNLLKVTHTQLAQGRWLTGAFQSLPVIVLGATAAKWLGVTHPGNVQVLAGGRWYTVVGILAPSQLAAQLDISGVTGWTAASHYTSFGGHATTIYVRTVDQYVSEVGGVLGETANPNNPTAVDVSRPSDALIAKQAAQQAFTSVLLGIGLVALLVGATGVANTMVISVLERRAEIGLRRSLGATRGHIRLQFLAEALLMSAIGGLAGVMLGIAVTAGFARFNGWPVVVPLWASAGGFGVTLLVGVAAGLYPAMRAARVPPTEALAEA